MGCLGVHFAVTRDQARRLLDAVDEESDDAVLELIEEIEEEWDEDNLQESDKSWDAIHRCLSDGTLDQETGSYPLNRCIFGGRHLCFSGDYFVVYVAPDEVKDVATALNDLSKEWLENRYWKLPPDYGNKDEVDFEYTWENVGFLKAFFSKAAKAGRSVIFTVSQ
ncbi:MAG: YfbM family protein [Cyanobacteria bacterium HKST-UBA02]|nr:YfbM family protein [Cyanobacteria bacterium HKST-UBA02]